MLFKEIKAAWLYLLQHRTEEGEPYISGTSAGGGVTEQLGKAKVALQVAHSANGTQTKAQIC